MAVIPIGGVSAASILWRSRGSVHATVLVKGTFQFRHGGSMAQVEPLPIEVTDRHLDGDPTKSLVAASDLAPYRPQADVWLTGDACAPTQRPVERIEVRLSLFRDEVASIDKTVRVLGERAHPLAAPRRFTRMPLRWELARGGVGDPVNPVGMPRPSHIESIDYDDKAVGFGPIAKYWQTRRHHLADGVRTQLEQPVAEVPDDFDWQYFQAAPPDQRVPFLLGDEWLVLEGVHPELPRIQTQLPQVRGLARVMGERRGDIVYELPLEADTLSIHADAERCCVTWRGSMPVRSEEEARRMRVAVAIERAQAPIPWAHAWDLGEAAPDERPPPSVGLVGDGDTQAAGPPIALDKTALNRTMPSVAPPAPPQHEAVITTPAIPKPPRRPRRAWSFTPPPADSDAGEWDNEDTRLDMKRPVLPPANDSVTDLHEMQVPRGPDTQPSLHPSHETATAAALGGGDDALDFGPQGEHPRSVPPRGGPLPRPTDPDAFAATLRRAGASEEDIDAAVAAVHDQEDE